MTPPGAAVAGRVSKLEASLEEIRKAVVELPKLL